MLNHRRTFILACVVCLIMTVPTIAGEPGADSLKVTIQFDESLLVSQRDNIVAGVGRIDSILNDPYVYHNFVAYSPVTKVCRVMRSVTRLDTKSASP